jgi:hypothetical protein
MKQEDWPALKAEIETWGQENGYIIHSIQALKNPVGRTVAPVAVPKRKTDTEILRDYAQQRGLDPGVLDAGLALLDGVK